MGTLRIEKNTDLYEKIRKYTNIAILIVHKSKQIVDKIRKKQEKIMLLELLNR